MGGTEETRAAAVKVNDAASDAGSEDIEDESDEDDDEDEEGEEGEGEGHDDMEMAEDGAAEKPIENGDAKHDSPLNQKQQSDVMVH